MKRSKPAKRPEWQNLRTAAAAQSVSIPAFVAWRIEPVARIGREVFFLAGDVTKNRVANALAKIEPPEPIADSEAEREKILLTRAQREAQELRNAQMRKELAPIDLIAWTLSKVGSQISAILDSIPLKVKNILPRISAAEVEHIRREIIKAQNVAANVTVDLAEYESQRKLGNAGDPAA